MSGVGGYAALVAAGVFAGALGSVGGVTSLAAGMFAGSAAGPVLTRLVPPAAVRVVVGVLGLAFAATLWFRG